LIYQQENGFTDLAKPGRKRMEACARRQLLILEKSAADYLYGALIID